MSDKPTREEFLADILCTIIEGSPDIAYWATGRNTIRTQGDDWKYSSIELKPTEPAFRGKDPRNGWQLVNASVVENGIAAIKDGRVKVSSDILGWIVGGSNENDAGNIDAICADCIVQAALFGDIVFG